MTTSPPCPGGGTRLHPDEFELSLSAKYPTKVAVCPECGSRRTFPKSGIFPDHLDHRGDPDPWSA